MNDAGGVDSGMDDAELAEREGYAEMAMGAARAQAKPGLDDDARERFRAFLRMFSFSAGVPVDGLETVLRPRRSIPRRMLVTTLLILGLGGAYTIADTRLNPPPRTKQWRPSFDPLLAQARGRVPGRPVTLGLRSQNSQGGRRCLVLGQLGQGRIGSQGAVFRELPAGTPPACIKRGQVAMTPVSNVGGRHPYSVLFGVAERDVHIRIGLAPPGREVTVASDGTFIYVAAGLKALARHKAYITDGSGRVRVRTLGTG